MLEIYILQEPSDFSTTIIVSTSSLPYLDKFPSYSFTADSPRVLWSGGCLDMSIATLVDFGSAYVTVLTCNTACLTATQCDAFVITIPSKCYLLKAACSPNIYDVLSTTYKKLDLDDMNSCKMAYH